MSDQADARSTSLTGVAAPERGWYRRWFALIQLAWVAAASEVWYLMPQWGPWLIALALAPWAIHAVRTREVWHWTPFDAALLFFVATAGVSLTAAYDPQGARAVFPVPIGWSKLWGLILAGLLFYALGALNTERDRRWAMGLISGFGAAVAVWFLSANDWNDTSAQWASLAPLGRLVQSLLPRGLGPALNANVAGGLVTLTLPMSLELAAEPARSPGRGSFLWAAWGMTSAALMGLALLLSGSRGAWLAFLGTVYLAATWWLAGRVAPRARRIAAFLGIVAVGALLGGLTLFTVPSLRALTLESEAVANRLRFFSQTALLVRDYPFTGYGLGQFPLVHSTYALLIHVPVRIYSYATVLGVAAEQGLAAALMLLGVWVGAAWMGLRALAVSERVPTGLVAGLLALAVLILHGASNNVIYGTQALVLLWLPVGLILAAAQQTRGQADHPTDPSTGCETNSRQARTVLWRKLALVGAVTTALITGILFHRPLAAAWHANLAAVHQTMVELSAYDWHHFDDPTLDEVRQREDLSTAIAHFERSLELDAGQVTARTRLAQIALARGAYDEALTHAQVAWDAGHRDRVTRLVLGEALAAQGLVDEAARLVRGLKWAEERFDGQAYYRYWVNGDWERAAYAWRALLKLDPENARVQQALRRAETSMAEEGGT